MLLPPAQLGFVLNSRLAILAIAVLRQPQLALAGLRLTLLVPQTTLHESIQVLAWIHCIEPAAERVRLPSSGVALESAPAVQPRKHVQLSPLGGWFSFVRGLQPEPLVPVGRQLPQPGFVGRSLAHSGR